MQHETLHYKFRDGNRRGRFRRVDFQVSNVHLNPSCVRTHRSNLLRRCKSTNRGISSGALLRTAGAVKLQLLSARKQWHRFASHSSCRHYRPEIKSAFVASRAPSATSPLCSAKRPARKSHRKTNTQRNRATTANRIRDGVAGSIRRGELNSLQVANWHLHEGTSPLGTSNSDDS